MYAGHVLALRYMQKIRPRALSPFWACSGHLCVCIHFMCALLEVGFPLRCHRKAGPFTQEEVGILLCQGLLGGSAPIVGKDPGDGCVLHSFGMGKGEAVDLSRVIPNIYLHKSP